LNLPPNQSKEVPTSFSFRKTTIFHVFHSSCWAVIQTFWSLVKNFANLKKSGTECLQQKKFTQNKKAFQNILYGKSSERIINSHMTLRFFFFVRVYFGWQQSNRDQKKIVSAKFFIIIVLP